MDEVETSKKTEEQDDKNSEQTEKPKQVESIEPDVHKSRMRRTLERQSKRNIFLMGLGGILIIVGLIVYGQSIIINFSLLMGKTKKQTNTQTTEDVITYIAPPILDPVSSATNSANAIFTGQITNADQVKLYINDELVDVAKPKEDNSFTFNDISLEEGENNVKAVAWIKDKHSNDSNRVHVTFLKNPPEISLDQPNDGDSFHGPSTLTVKGKTNPANTVRINNTLVITKDDGSFANEIVLNNGDNKIQIEVTDQAGNKATKEITVSYSQ